MGIATNWSACYVGIHDPRVVYSNGRALLLWKMCIAIGREWEQRNLANNVSPVKRQILMLHGDKAITEKHLRHIKEDLG